MTKYFRITAYSPEHNISFIIDSNGMFEKLWQFSAYVVSKGCKILEVGTDEQFKDINIEKADYDPNHIILRACQKGKPIYTQKTIDGVTYTAIKLENKSYIIK